MQQVCVHPTVTSDTVEGVLGRLATFEREGTCVHDAIERG